MPEYLAFRLTAPLAAMGNLAGHSRRGSERWPGKSAVLGLVGAALGIERRDAASQAKLVEGYAVNLLVRRGGSLLMDFHTTQTVPSAAVKRPMSRRDALERASAQRRLNTTITQREYRQDVLIDTALERKTDVAWPLETLEAALRSPHYILYFGRKSCPLSSPLAPLQLTAEDPLAAMRRYAVESVHPANAAMLADEDFAVCEPESFKQAPAHARIERRWDAATDRRTWQFQNRAALVIPLSGEK